MTLAYVCELLSLRFPLYNILHGNSNMERLEIRAVLLPVSNHTFSRYFLGKYLIKLRFPLSRKERSVTLLATMLFWKPFPCGMSH